MSKFVKKPLVVEATQWHVNGDHPEDGVGDMVQDNMGDEYVRVEGAVVRFFRDPNHDGMKHHDVCDRIWDAHGWIDTREGGHTVCPGDWIITDQDVDPSNPRHGHWYYPCKPDVFEATYDPAEDDA